MVSRNELPEQFKACPIEIAVNYIGKKWAINIIRDLFKGNRKFSDFLKANPELSTKVLSERLKELEGDGFIQKKVISLTPLQAHYILTDKGKALNGILFELGVFSLKYCPKEVYGKNGGNIEADIKLLRSAFPPN